MIITCPICQAGMQVPPASAERPQPVRCPVCYGVFVPVLPDAQLVDPGEGDPAGDADILDSGGGSSLVGVSGATEADGAGTAGWYIETDSGDLGPFTSRQVAGAARRGQLSRDAVLRHAAKGFRVVAGRVPLLFRCKPNNADAGGGLVEAGVAGRQDALGALRDALRSRPSARPGQRAHAG